MRGLPLLYIQTNLNNSTRQVVGILTFFKYSSASLPLLLYVTFWSTRFLGALPKLNNISQICSASLIPPCLKIPSVLVELDQSCDVTSSMIIDKLKHFTETRTKILRNKIVKLHTFINPVWCNIRQLQNIVTFDSLCRWKKYLFNTKLHRLTSNILMIWFQCFRECLSFTLFIF